MQKRASGGAGAPQLGQTRSSFEPHDMQKRAPAGFSVPHEPHASPAIELKIAPV
jgi:hypothetical protein